MFNRTFQVKLLKKNKNEEAQPSQYDTHIEGKVAHITFTIDRIVSKAARAALAYVVLDTARQVVLAKTSKP